MHYNDIPLYPYHSDPLRIMVPRNPRPAGAPECSSGPPASAAGTDRPPGAEHTSPGPADVREDPPQPVPAEAGREAAAPQAADEGGSPPGAAPAADRLRHSAPEAQFTQADAGGGVEGDGPPQLPSESEAKLTGRVNGGADRNGGDDAASEAGGSAPEHDDAQSERNRIMRAWLNEHFEIVEAMALAGEAPVRPAPPPDPATEPPPPVHVRKGDRWNKPKMAEFLRQLAATHSITAAARAVGMSRRSAHKLRNRLKGQPFDIAWEAAFRHGYDDLAHASLELALEGEEVPHYYKGELVGTHRKRHPQLMIGLLKMRNRDGAPMLGRYGAAAEFWSEHWDQITHRVETGSVTWDDERRALGSEAAGKLDLPDEKRQIDQIILRNQPDDPPKSR